MGKRQLYNYVLIGRIFKDRLKDVNIMRKYVRPLFGGNEVKSKNPI